MSPELHALAGAYALDALDDRERGVFEEHLAECEDCAAEVWSFTDTAAELSNLTLTAPPPHLRADVLSAISRVRPLAPVTDNVSALRRSGASRSAWQLLAAACALIAILAGAWGYQQHRDARTTDANTAGIVRVLAAGDAAAVSGAVGMGHATVVYSRSRQEIAVLGTAVPTLPADKTYQLWLINKDAAGKPSFTSAGIFQPDSSGTVRKVTAGDLTSDSQLGVSIEPAGGSARPTDVIATMHL
jgi:anti-sigma-K factor RskA